jgi:hypothetical protein
MEKLAFIALPLAGEVDKIEVCKMMKKLVTMIVGIANKGWCCKKDLQFRV